MAKVYNLSIVLSAVNIATDLNQETIHQLKRELEGILSYDRNTINSWEDKEFLEAIKATGKKKLIMTAL